MTILSALKIYYRKTSKKLKKKLPFNCFSAHEKAIKVHKLQFTFDVESCCP